MDFEMRAGKACNFLRDVYALAITKRTVNAFLSLTL